MDDSVALRPVTEEDCDFAEHLLLDPVAAGVFAWFGWNSPGRFRARWAEDGWLSDRQSILMVGRGEERLGFVSWRRAREVHASFCWNVGIALAPQARGRGYGTRAQRMLVRYLFTHTLVNRIEADTELDNVAEQRALEKAGFTREGVIRGVTFRAGSWRDGVTYSVLRSEVDLGDPDARFPEA